MSILPQIAPIHAPKFFDSPQNRAHLLETLISSAEKKPATSSVLFHEISDSTGADWLVTRDFFKALPAEIFEKHSSLNYLQSSKGWFSEDVLLSQLSRHFRTQWHDFAVFSAMYDEYCITMQSLHQLVATSKRLTNHGLNRNLLLEKISFVSMATENMVIRAVPLFFGYAFAAANFYFSGHGLSKIDISSIINTADNFWQSHYGFDFKDFYFNASVENEDNQKVYLEIFSELASISGIEFEVDSSTENPKKHSLLNFLRSLLNAALRADSNLCHRIFESSTGYAPFPVRATATAA